jgi:sporulation protein YlmC with PRC-barrel domain
MLKQLIVMVSICAGFLLMACSSVADQTSISAQDLSSQSAVDITTWDQAALYNGWSANALLGKTVQGEDGEEIGEVENIIVGPDNKVQKIIVEAGGFLDIGDTHLSVAWDQAEVGPGLEYVTVPIDKENVGGFSLFDGNDSDISSGPRAWRVTELIDDYVTLQGDVDYGYVDDLVFDQQGQLQAVVVTPDITYGSPGYYAYPYASYGGYEYDPGLDVYELPYTQDQITALEPFDYEVLEDEGMYY